MIKMNIKCLGIILIAAIGFITACPNDSGNAVYSQDNAKPSKTRNHYNSNRNISDSYYASGFSYDNEIYIGGNLINKPGTAWVTNIEFALDNTEKRYAFVFEKGSKFNLYSSSSEGSPDNWSINQTGAFRTSGNILYITAEDQTRSFKYTVNGNTLRMIHPQGNVYIFKLGKF